MMWRRYAMPVIYADDARYFMLPFSRHAPAARWLRLMPIRGSAPRCLSLRGDARQPQRDKACQAEMRRLASPRARARFR